MSAFTESWAMTNDQVSTPAEKLVLYYTAGTVGTDNFMGEVRLDDLADFALVSEPELRATLNALVDKGLIRNVRPREDQPSKNPRIFDCELNTPQEWHWDF